MPKSLDQLVVEYKANVPFSSEAQNGFTVALGFYRQLAQSMNIAQVGLNDLATALNLSQAGVPESKRKSYDANSIVAQMRHTLSMCLNDTEEAAPEDLTKQFRSGGGTESTGYRAIQSRHNTSIDELAQALLGVGAGKSFS